MASRENALLPSETWTVYADLTSDTEPGAIADAQRADVEVAWDRGVRDVDAISARCVLCRWIVARRLYELGLGPQPESPAARQRARAELAAAAVRAAMADGRTRTAAEVAAATGYSRRTVLWHLSQCAKRTTPASRTAAIRWVLAD